MKTAPTSQATLRSRSEFPPEPSEIMKWCSSAPAAEAPRVVSVASGDGASPSVTNTYVVWHAAA